MKVFYQLISLALTATTLPAHAQQAPSPAADTTGREEFVPGKGTDRYYWGTLTKADGTQLAAYLPTLGTGYEGRVTYFLPPLSVTNELRHRHGLNIKEVKAMTVHGRSYEAIALAGKPAEVLALRLFDGPVSLATYAEPRAIPLPIPLAAGVMPIVGIPISAKSHWYLRRNGEWTEIRRAGFAQTMSAYLADNPELAAKVARQEPNYLHPNTPAIIAEYNRAKAATGQ